MAWVSKHLASSSISVEHVGVMIYTKTDSPVAKGRGLVEVECEPSFSTRAHICPPIGFWQEQATALLPSFLPPVCCLCTHRGSHELQDSSNVHGDWLLCGLCEWMDPGLLYNAHWDMDLVWGGKHRSDQFKLLLQPLEGLRFWFNWSIRLQGYPIDVRTQL
jgi:hypothetical protein